LKRSKYPFYCSQQDLIVILCLCSAFKYFDYYDQSTLHKTLQNFAMMVSTIFGSLIDLDVWLEEQEQNLLMPKQI
jgi:hypothetical protein